MTFLSDDAAIEAARRALASWGVGDQIPELVARRENCVFRVIGPNKALAALRLHRPGYNGDVEITSELALMQAAGERGLAVPQPIPATNGARLVRIEGAAGAPMSADLLTWLPGEPFGRAGVPLKLGRSALKARFRDLGAATARLHLALDDWTPPDGFNRHAWDREGLLGASPVWGRFWENPMLNTAQRSLLERARSEAWAHLGALAAESDYGLIHADLVRENVLIGRTGPEIIDFGDAGWGWRAFELTTILNRNREEPEYPLIEASLIEGYEAHRPTPPEFLAAKPLFFALRSFTYLGWIADRIDEPGAFARLRGMMDRATADADAYLGSLESA